MLKLKDAIETIIASNPFLEDALSNSYLNTSAFAVFIKPQIEVMTKKSVTVSSIKMALSRIETDFSSKKAPIFIPSDFFLRKDIELINIERTQESQSFIDRLYDSPERLVWAYFAVIQGSAEIDIVFSSKLSDLVDSIVPEGARKLHMSSLALIWVHLDEDDLNTPWIFYNFSKKLYFFDVNVLQVISTYRELGIIVKWDDIKRAFDVIVN